MFLKAQWLDPVCSSLISHNCLLSSCSGVDCIILNKRTCVLVTRPTNCRIGRRIRLVAYSMGPHWNGGRQHTGNYSMLTGSICQNRYQSRSSVTEIHFPESTVDITSGQKKHNVLLYIYCISHITLLYKIVNNQVAINKFDRLLPNLHLSCHPAAHSLQTPHCTTSYWQLSPLNLTGSRVCICRGVASRTHVRTGFHIIQASTKCPLQMVAVGCPDMLIVFGTENVIIHL